MLNNEKKLLEVGVAISDEIERIGELYNDSSNTPMWFEDFAKSIDRNFELLAKWRELNIKLKKIHGIK